MISKCLKEIKNTLSEEDFKQFIASLESSIKVDRIPYGKKTNQQEFINICEILKGVYSR